MLRLLQAVPKPGPPVGEVGLGRLEPLLRSFEVAGE